MCGLLKLMIEGTKELITCYVCWLDARQNPMNPRTLKFIARDPFISKEQQHAATSAFAIGNEGYDIPRVNFVP